MPPASPRSSNGHITRDTKVSLGVMIALAGVIVGGGYHVLSTVLDLSAKVERIGSDIREIKAEIRDGAQDVRKNTILLAEVATRYTEFKARMEGRLDRLEDRIKRLEKH